MNIKIYLDNLASDMKHRFERVLFHKEQMIQNYKKHFEQHSLDKKFAFIQKEIDLLSHNFQGYMNQIINQKQTQLNYLKSAYEQNHPDKKIKDGYVQLSRNNKIIKLDDLHVGDSVDLNSSKYVATCKIMEHKQI